MTADLTFVPLVTHGSVPLNVSRAQAALLAIVPPVTSWAHGRNFGLVPPSQSRAQTRYSELVPLTVPLVVPDLVPLVSLRPIDRVPLVAHRHPPDLTRGIVFWV